MYVTCAWTALGYLHHDDHHHELFSLFTACVVSVTPLRFIIFLPCSEFVCTLWRDRLGPFSTFVNVILIGSVRLSLDLHSTVYPPFLCSWTLKALLCQSDHSLVSSSICSQCRMSSVSFKCLCDAVVHSGSLMCVVRILHVYVHVNYTNQE